LESLAVEAGGGVPDPRRMVDAAGGEPGPVRRDHDFGHRFVVAGEGGPVAGSTCMAPQDAHRARRGCTATRIRPAAQTRRRAA
jgi:hypothetical protein